jgi:hypothetical protein
MVGMKLIFISNQYLIASIEESAVSSYKTGSQPKQVVNRIRLNKKMTKGDFAIRQ